jgi:hypothetical protein
MSWVRDRQPPFSWNEWVRDHPVRVMPGGRSRRDPAADVTALA